MRSLRTKITLMTVFVVILSVVVVSFLSVIFIRNNEYRKAEQLLQLLCETGEYNLDYYFNSVQKSVVKVAQFVMADIDGLDDEEFSQHMTRVWKYFDEMASKTNGVFTYYYRIDPAVSDTVKGFWYTNLDGQGFKEHEVTDITLYDTADTSKLVWFTVPKYEGRAIWLPPYITDTINLRVISYNVPIYYRGTFVGVVGIEIDYSTMAEQVDSIRLYSNGYAFLSDGEGNLFYHPKIDLTKLSPEEYPAVPDGVVSQSTFINYTFDGVDKVAAWMPLSNGMRIVVTAPVTETEGDWGKLVFNIMLVAVGVLALSIAVTMVYTKRIVKPLEQLTEAAKQVDKGNYDISLNYEKDDEVGRLTSTFKHLTDHMKDNITNLNRQVFVDAMTNVKNKGAFSAFIEDMQTQMDKGKPMEFAIGVFDCDGLKAINDKYGHEKGDMYLKAASRAICRVYKHSPVFRIGGDEFAIILRNEDYHFRDDLVEEFEKTRASINGSVENEWEKINISMGFAVFDRENDRSVNDVVRRADRIMYENKRIRKNGR